MFIPPQKGAKHHLLDPPFFSIPTACWIVKFSPPEVHPPIVFEPTPGDEFFPCPHRRTRSNAIHPWSPVPLIPSPIPPNAQTCWNSRFLPPSVNQCNGRPALFTICPIYPYVLILQFQWCEYFRILWVLKTCLSSSWSDVFFCLSHPHKYPPHAPNFLFVAIWWFWKTTFTFLSKPFLFFFPSLTTIRGFPSIPSPVPFGLSQPSEFLWWGQCVNFSLGHAILFLPAAPLVPFPETRALPRRPFLHPFVRWNIPFFFFALFAPPVWRIAQSCLFSTPAPFCASSHATPKRRFFFGCRFYCIAPLPPNLGFFSGPFPLRPFSDARIRYTFSLVPQEPAPHQCQGDNSCTSSLCWCFFFPLWLRFPRVFLHTPLLFELFFWPLCCYW